MTAILTVASQKGGVGKTTTSVNLAAALALAGRPTLLFDFDPQGNASSGVGLAKLLAGSGKPVGRGGGVLASALSGAGLTHFVQQTRFANLSLLPSSPDYSDLELIQQVQDRGLEKFRAQLSQAVKPFDFVLIDCPPSLGGIPSIALAVSNRVLIPVQCEYYAMEGLSQILPVINRLQSGANPSLKIAGLLMTMFSSSLDLSIEVEREVRDYFADSVFQSIIPRDVVIAEAASHGMPAIEYASLSRGAWSYVELAREVLSHDWS